MKRQEIGTLFLVFVPSNREVRSSFGSNLINTFHNRGGIMKELNSTSQTSICSFAEKLRGFFSSLQEGVWAFSWDSKMHLPD